MRRSGSRATTRSQQRHFRRVLRQFRYHVIPGGDASTLSSRNSGRTTSGIDDDVRTYDRCGAAVSCAKVDVRVRREAARPQPAERDAGGDSGCAKPLVETGAIDHIADPIGMAEEIFVILFARAAGPANPKAASSDRRVVEKRLKPYRRDGAKRRRGQKLEAIDRQRTRIGEDNCAPFESQQARNGRAGRPRSHHETVGVQRFQIQISP